MRNLIFAPVFTVLFSVWAQAHAQSTPTPTVEQAQQFLIERLPSLRALPQAQRSKDYYMDGSSKHLAGRITRVTIPERCVVLLHVDYEETKNYYAAKQSTHRLIFTEYSTADKGQYYRHLTLKFAGPRIQAGEGPDEFRIWGDSNELSDRLLKAIAFLGKDCPPKSAF